MEKKRIAVLVSGGVDSSVVVHKLFNEGHELHLFYIKIANDNGEGDCSSEEDIELCTLIACKYGLPFKVVSLHEEYWKYVMSYTLETVRKGLTPHPDMMCNKIVKFGFFEERWGHEFDYTATGHYASIVEEDGKRFLSTAVDPVKDQTDFLAQISGAQLDHLLFPLGGMPKEEVRRLALEASLPTATRKDSQGICFLGKINYNDFLRRHIGERPGAVIEIETGKKIGEHKGIWFHTIGQRKGLGLGGGPWFVVRKNIRDNVLYVSHGYDTPLQYGRLLRLGPINWITENPYGEDAVARLYDISADGVMNVAFKTRHTPEFFNGRLKESPDGDWLLESDRDVQGIAPGQYATIYTPDRRLCIGSGMITL